MGWVRFVGYGEHVPVRAEVFAEHRVVRLADFAALSDKPRSSVCVVRVGGNEQLTMCRRSLENVKRSTASILSNGSSESLILRMHVSQASRGGAGDFTCAANRSGLSR